jgi:hypothetical protein
MLALAQPSAAEIVYTQVHRALPISRNYQYLDINGDGVPDVAFLHYTYGLSNSINNAIVVDAHKNGVIPIGERYAQALSAGATIGPSANFRGGSLRMAHSVFHRYIYRHYATGPWNNVQGRYLGVSFKIAAETHYGWVRMSVSDPRNLMVLISGYAYETVANQPLLAGQTSGGAEDDALSKHPSEPVFASLGTLAAGSYGLLLWRRKESDLAAPE